MRWLQKYKWPCLIGFGLILGCSSLIDKKQTHEFFQSQHLKFLKKFAPTKYRATTQKGAAQAQLSQNMLVETVTILRRHYIFDTPSQRRFGAFEKKRSISLNQPVDRISDHELKFLIPKLEAHFEQMEKDLRSLGYHKINQRINFEQTEEETLVDLEFAYSF
ncbi:MAG: hypothetical protein AAF226_10895 [Verrucomicrobiota bacterium]